MKELFMGILGTSLSGSVMILVVLALRLVLKKAPKSVFCLLWLMTGLRLVLPIHIESPLSLQPDLTEITQIHQSYESEYQPGQYTALEIPEISHVPAIPDMEKLPEDVQVVMNDHAVSDHRQRTVDYGAVLAWIWTAGVAGLGIYSMVSYRLLKKKVRNGVWQREGWLECNGIDTAFVLGFFPARIYLPAGLTEKEQQFILAHERTHISRGDHWIKSVGFVVLALHWFNPLVWIAYACLCRDIEMTCDEQVVRNMTLPERKAYSRALLSCSARHINIGVCPVAFGEVGIKQRVLGVLNYRKPGFWISLVAVLAVAFVVGCLMTSPENREKTPLEEERVWNLEAKAVEVTPGGLTVEFTQHGPFKGYDRAELQYGSYYTLQRLENGQWADVEMLPQEYDVAWTMEAYIIQRHDTTRQRIDWEWLYGKLPAGHYRIGKDVDLFRGTGDYDTEMFWAEFDIKETELEQSAWSMDMTEEEYLALCRNAVEELQNRAQFHISETLIYFTGDHEDSRNIAAYWLDGKNWLRESYITRMKQNNDFLYYDGTMYLRKQEESGEVSWNRIDGGGSGYGLPWLCLLQWENQPMTFEETNQEGEELRVAVAAQATPPTLGWDDIHEYSVVFFFDRAGNLTRTTLSAERENLRVISNLTIETVLGIDIHNKLENVAAQRPGVPDLNQNLTGEQWLEKCRTALEAYQSQGSWVILVDNNSIGETGLNETSSQLWYIHGEDWVKQAIVNGADFLQERWILKKENKCYFRESHTVHNSVNGDGITGHWQESKETTLSIPWLLEFKWNSEAITFLEARTDGDGAMVYLNVADSPLSTQDKAVEEYLLILWLRPNGELWQLRMEYTEIENTGGKNRMQTTISPNAAAPEEAEQMIHQCHSEALLHIYGSCNDPDCTNPAHHH